MEELHLWNGHNGTLRTVERLTNPGPLFFVATVKRAKVWELVVEVVFFFFVKEYEVRLEADAVGVFGFNVRFDSGDRWPAVSRVAPDSPADLCYPPMRLNDRLLSVNGHCVDQLDHHQVLLRRLSSFFFGLFLSPSSFFFWSIPRFNLVSSGYSKFHWVIAFFGYYCVLPGFTQTLHSFT